ncbi:hypothetical protein Tco_0289808 [Tanacetum coccineum]
MVAYLLKPEGSEDFHQIVDFLNTSHIKYALTENPTIHVSLIQQFWQTASASTSENGEMEITATIDGRVKTVTEASIRRHLKLEDSDGISTLPNTEIFEQLALMGYVSNSDKLTFQKGHFSPQWRFLIHTILHCLSPKKTSWEQFSSNIATAIICLATNRTFNFSRMIFEGMGQGSTVQSDSHHTTTSSPSTPQPPTSPPSMKTFYVVEEAATFPHDSPLLRVHSLGSDEGSMTLHELTLLYTTLSKKVDTLESDLKGFTCVQIDAKIREFEDRQDTQIHCADVARVHTYSRRRRTFSTSSGGISTAKDSVSTVGASMPVSTAGMDQGSIPSPSASKDKGKAIMTESEPEQATTKLKQRQEIVVYEVAIRLQEQLDEEESQRIARDAEGFTDAEWDDILARVAADEDLVQQLQAGEKYSEEDLPMKLVELVNQIKKFFAQQRAEAKRNKPMTPAQQKAYMSTYIKNQKGGYFIKQLKSLFFEQRLKRAGQEVFKETAKRQKIKEASGSSEEQSAKKEKELSEEELQKLMMIVPVEEVYVEALQVELKRLFEPDIDDILWKLQRYMHDPLTWRLYDTCGVHHVSTDRGHDIFMLVEKDYPLTRGL